MNRRITITFLLVLAAVLLTFWWPWLSGQSDFYFEDTCNVFEPLCTYTGYWLARLHLPLWDPYNYCGMSLIAVPSPPLFYPPNLLFAWLPYSPAVAVIMILSTLCAAVGTCLLVGALGWGWLPAILAACLVSLSGYMFSGTNNYTLVATASWLPLCLLSVNRAASDAQRHGLRWCLLLSSCTALMILAGRPEISGAELILIAGYAVALRLSGRSTNQRLLLQAKAVLIGLLLAMPTIVPAFEWLPRSRRALGLDPSEVLQFSANWLDLLSMVASQPLGNLQINADHFRALVDPKNFPPYMISAFVGYPALVIAALGLQKRGGWAYAAALVLLVGSLVGAAAAYIPFMPELVRHLPLLSAGRFPSKLLFFAIFAIALLSARGLHLYTSEGGNLRAPVVVACAGLLAGVLLWSSSQLLLPFTSASPAAMKLSAQHDAAVSICVWSAAGLATALVLLAGQRFHKRPAAAIGVVTIIVVSLLVHAFSALRIGAPGGFFLHKPLMAQWLQQVQKLEPGEQAPRTMLLSLEGLSVPDSELDHDAVARSTQIYRYQRDLLKPFGNVDCRIPSPWGFGGPTDGEYMNFMLNLFVRSTQSTAQLPPGEGNKSDLPLYRLLQCTATKYVVTQMFRPTLSPSQNGGAVLQPAPIPIMDPAKFALKLQDQRLNARIYELKPFLPRAYLSTRWSYRGRDDLLRSMAQANEFDPQKMTLLEDDNQAAIQLSPAVPTVARQVVSAPAQTVPSSMAGTIQVDLHESDPEDIAIRAHAPLPSVLVLCDQYYPGWQAEVDGQPSRILRANGFMRAVILKQGDHLVTFCYRPHSLLEGALLSLLGLLWAVLLWRQPPDATRLASVCDDSGAV